MNNILVVEDCIPIREEIKDILLKENFNVYEASNGYDGLEFIKQTLPDLIISDIAMPLLDGYEFFKELKKYEKTENIPFIFLSAKSEIRDIRNGMNMGADDYLTKPISPDDLIMSINNKLQLRSKINNRISEFKSQVTKYLPHELITPLNGILGLSEYLKEDIDLSKAEIAKMANSINICGQRLYHLIENYLMYTNLASLSTDNKKKGEMSDICMLETQEVINSVISNIAKDRINDIFLIAEKVNIECSEFLFIKAVKELINNAIKFSDKGSKIIVSSLIQDNKYNLKIVNFNNGISDKQIEEIGAFVQFNRKKNEQQGLGLGLEIVRLIIELNDGEMIVNSKTEQYFKVIVRLPLPNV